MMQRSFKRQLRAWTVGWLILTVGAVLLGTLSILKEQEISVTEVFSLYITRNAAALIREDLLSGAYPIANDRLNGLLRDIPIEQACFTVIETSSGSTLFSAEKNLGCEKAPTRGYSQKIRFSETDLESINAPFELIARFSLPETLSTMLARRGTLLAFLVGLFFVAFVAFILSLITRFLAQVEASMRGNHPDVTANPARQADETSIESEPFEEVRRLRELRVQLDQTERQLRQRQIEDQARKAEIFLARQVAHDIRSPLAALEVLSRMLKDSHEDLQEITQSAVNRIRDIANDLLSRTRIESSNPLLLSSVLSGAFSEKRIELSTSEQTDLRLTIDDGARSAFARVPLTEFQRVISNLLNNAFEALPDGRKGRVELRLARTSAEAATIEISDTGIGIPDAILKQILTGSGGSFGKRGGSGLGIAHAREAIRDWGGTIDISSAVGKGTCVRLTIPLEPHPIWFVQKISLSRTRLNLIIDDDVAIHQTWRHVLAPIREAYGELKIESYSQLSEAAARITEVGAHNVGTVLCDYHFRGDLRTGLEFQHELESAGSFILVTSRAEDETLQKSCAKTGTVLLPKSLIPFTEVVIETSS